MWAYLKYIRDQEFSRPHPVVVLLTYPGVWAIGLHRITHALHHWKIPLVPRLIALFSRFLSGVEIPPGAKVGKFVFIDHGGGTVIGETAIIGNYVRIFHGVTLGATDFMQSKRHPTIGNHVMIGANATILGNITIGDHCKIGAGAVVTKDMPENSTARPAATVYVP